jgi:hypothetical protein
LGQVKDLLFFGETFLEFGVQTEESEGEFEGHFLDVFEFAINERNNGEDIITLETFFNQILACVQTHMNAKQAQQVANTRKLLLGLFVYRREAF